MISSKHLVLAGIARQCESWTAAAILLFSKHNTLPQFPPTLTQGFMYISV
jgi:hypothetical protein